MSGEDTAAERKAKLDAVKPWVAACAAFCHLDHWNVTVEHEPPDADAVAAIGRWRGQMDASLYLSDRFFTLTEKERREVVAHELAHAQMCPMWELWLDLDEVLGKPAYAMFRNHAQIAEEMVVEALARVIGPLLPAPPTAAPQEAP